MFICGNHPRNAVDPIACKVQWTEDIQQYIYICVSPEQNLGCVAKYGPGKHVWFVLRIHFPKNPAAQRYYYCRNKDWNLKFK